MVAVTEKIRSMVDVLVRGFDQREDVFEEMGNDANDYMEYPTQNNLALEPSFSYRERNDRNEGLKVVPHSGYKSHEVMILEPRSFKDSAQVVQHLMERKTVVLNLHLLDKEQSQRTIDFVCGAAHALNGKPQKVGDLVFVFTPSNVTLSLDAHQIDGKFDDSLWRAPLQ
ncbi:MAG: cell division protein SepF [Fusobacterium sp.]|nr:cell division protein SepF [Fusobacterium sp.]